MFTDTPVRRAGVGYELQCADGTPLGTHGYANWREWCVPLSERSSAPVQSGAPATHPTPFVLRTQHTLRRMSRDRPCDCGGTWDDGVLIEFDDGPCIIQFYW